jgi:hypothetical protein
MDSTLQQEIPLLAGEQEDRFPFFLGIGKPFLSDL